MLSSAKIYLTLVKDLIIAANTQRSDFHIMELMNHGRPVSLHAVTRGGDMSATALGPTAADDGDAPAWAWSSNTTRVSCCCRSTGC